jgi:ribosomal protein S27E
MMNMKCLFKKNTIMGKMKEVFMEMIEHEYKGDHDAYLEDLARQSCEEFSYVNGQPCPNCHNYTLHRNETEAACDACGQEFVYVESALRFK